MGATQTSGLASQQHSSAGQEENVGSARMPPLQLAFRTHRCLTHSQHPESGHKRICLGAVHSIVVQSYQRAPVVMLHCMIANPAHHEHA